MRGLLFLLLLVGCAHDETWSRESAPRDYRIESLGMLGHDFVGFVAIKPVNGDTRYFSATSFLPEVETVDPKAYELMKKAIEREDSAFEGVAAGFGVLALCLVPQLYLPFAVTAGLSTLPLQLSAMRAGEATSYYEMASDQFNETLSAKLSSSSRTPAVAGR